MPIALVPVISVWEFRFAKPGEFISSAASVDCRAATPRGSITMSSGMDLSDIFFKHARQSSCRIKPAAADVESHAALRDLCDPVCPVEVGHRTNSICVLHHASMKYGGRKLKWDVAAERIIGDDEANAILTIRMRAPYVL